MAGGVPGAPVRALQLSIVMDGNQAVDFGDMGEQCPAIYKRLGIVLSRVLY